MDELPAIWMRQLPNGKPISALGFGCASLWAKPHFPERKAQSIIEAAYAEGINHFDTGPSYGPGHGERRLGQFIAGKDPEKLVLSTKVGTNFLDGRVVRSFKREPMMRSFEDSLARLGRDRVDIVYLHGPTLSDLTDEAIDFLLDLKSQGRTTYTGINSFDRRVLDAVVGKPLDAVMLQYNASDLSASSQIVQLADDGKIIVSATALGRAKFALSTFWPRNRDSQWYLLRMLRHEPLFFLTGPRLARRLAQVGKPATEAAIQFTVGNPRILSSLFGTSQMEHVVENARAGHRSLTRAQLNSIAGAKRFSFWIV